MNRSTRGVQQVNGAVQLAGQQPVNPTAAVRSLVALIASLTDSSTGDARMRVATVAESYNFATWGRQRFGTRLKRNILSPWA